MASYDISLPLETTSSADRNKMTEFMTDTVLMKLALLCYVTRPVREGLLRMCEVVIIFRKAWLHSYIDSVRAAQRAQYPRYG